jgi:hypothetical protein
LISIIEATDRFRSRLDRMIYTRRSFVVLIIRVPRRAIRKRPVNPSSLELSAQG